MRRPTPAASAALLFFYWSFPALGRRIVAGLRFDPAFARFLLPERRLGLEVVHDELARGEGLAAMGARHGDEDDLIGGLELAVAVHDGAVDHLPARGGLLDDFANRPFGHPGIVLERHRNFAHQP